MLIFKPFIFRLSAAISLVLLYGCASSPEKPQQPETSLAPAKPVEAPPQAKLKEAATAIDPDVMFMLLTAELAGQRGQYGIALEGYMEAAKRVRDPRFAERAAMIAMYLKDGKRLDESVKLWLKQDANNITARKFAALSALKASDKAAAVGHVGSLLKNDPAGFDKTMLELATILQKENKAEFIIDVLDTVSSQNPDQAMVYFVQALLAAQLDKQELAETKAMQSLKVQPGWDKALMLQAQLSMASGRFDKAIAVLENAVQKFPDDIKIKKMLAQVLIKDKRYDRAIAVYQSLVKANPKEHDSLMSLGVVYLQQDKFDEAEEAFEKLLDDPEWRAQATYYLGKIAEQQDDVDQALAWYDKVKDERLGLEAGAASVALLGKERKFAQAEQRLETLAKKYPSQKIRVLLLHSELLNRQGDYQKAFDLLSKGLLDAPDDKNLLYSRALMAEHIGKLDVLEADLKKIIAKHPDNAEALNALGYTLTDKTQRYQEAEAYLLRALKLAPDEAVILDSYGWLQFKQGKTANALQYLERAYTGQQEAEIAAHYAEVLWSVGQKEKAKKVFDRAFKESPDDSTLLDFKVRVLDKAR